MHKSRSNRRANETRRNVIALKHIPLSQEEIKKRTEDNKKAKEERYPHPPKYRYSYNDAKPQQPLCYKFQLV